MKADASFLKVFMLLFSIIRKPDQEKGATP